MDGASPGWAGPVAPSAVTAQPSRAEASLELTASSSRRPTCHWLGNFLGLLSLGFEVWAVWIWSGLQGALGGHILPQSFISGSWGYQMLLP